MDEELQEEAMPSREIIEQLDDDDNIVSSSVTNPEDKSILLQHVLSRVDLSSQGEKEGHVEGVGNVSSSPLLKQIVVPDNDGNTSIDATTTGGPVGTNLKSPSKSAQRGTSNDENRMPSKIRQGSLNPESRLSSPTKTPASSKKSVSFAEGTKEEPEFSTALRPSPRAKDGLPAKHQAMIEKLKRAVMRTDDESQIAQGHTQAELVHERARNALRNSLSPSASTYNAARLEAGISHCKPASKPTEVTDGAAVFGANLGTSPARIPANEPPADASLRSQMLKYNMGQVGSIVAEIDLDDTQSEDSWNSTDEQDEDSDVVQDVVSVSDEEEEEDEHGRTTSKMLSKDYVNEMNAMQKRLGAIPILNVGPKEHGTGDLDFILAAEASVSDDIEPSGKFMKDQRLDIQNSNPVPRPDVQEASEPHSNATSQELGEKKSRFKQTRSANILKTPLAPQESSTDPKSNKPSLIHGDILERKPPPTESSTAKHSIAESVAQSPPDEQDDTVFEAKQLNNEYHRLRNRMIHREGGFLQSEAEKEEEEDMYERKDGSEKKVSRFMAARLGK